MAEWITWWSLAGMLVILELFTGTFYLLMIAIGMAAGGVAALFGASFSLQLVSAALTGASATFMLRHGKIGKMNRTHAARDPNVHQDIGQSITVKEWNERDHASRPRARVMYRGALWDVELAEGGIAQPGTFVIREMRGSCLIVGNKISGNN